MKFNEIEVKEDSFITDKQMQNITSNLISSSPMKEKMLDFLREKMKTKMEIRLVAEVEEAGSKYFIFPDDTTGYKFLGGLPLSAKPAKVVCVNSNNEISMYEGDKIGNKPILEIREALSKKIDEDFHKNIKKTLKKRNKSNKP